MCSEKKMLRDDLSRELKKLISFDNSFPPGKTSDISNYIYKILTSCGYKVNFYENESDKQFYYLARKIFDSDLPLDQKMHLRYFVEKIDRICDQAEDIADEIQIYAIKRSI